MLTALRSQDAKNDNAKANNNENAAPPDTKKAKPGFVRNLCEYSSQYSSSSSIHGIQYLGEQKRTVVEKLWWLMVFVASLYMCIYMIIKTYDKWQTSPVIVSFARSSTPVWQIPFPAVTVCSETKTRQSVFNFTEIYHKNTENNITKEELAALEKISLVCDSHLHAEGNKTIDYDTIDFLTKVSQPFDEVFYECKWMNAIVSCSDLFTPTLSEEGVCFTFNMLDREELYTNVVFQNADYLHHGVKATNWTLEDGYPKNLKQNTFPKRAMSAGQDAGLSVLLRAYEKDLDYTCKGPVQGFKMLLHHAAEIPRVSQQYFRAPLNQEIVVAIKPDMMTTSSGLKSYHPHKRQCYFPTERQLRFYQVYTQQNCEVECLANFTLRKCECVSYFMPHDEDTKLCGAGNTRCVHGAQIELVEQELEASISTYENENTGANSTEHQQCDCLPACTSLTYNAETSQVDFNWPKVFQASKREDKNLIGAKMTGVTLFFKEMQFITSERSELYGPTDFLANCGGLLGLFMGFSFLSVIEIFYFCTLRLMCNVKNYGRYFWSGSSNLLEDSECDHKE